MAAPGCGGENRPFQIRIVKWTNDYNERDADRSADIGQQFPVAKVRSDGKASSGVVMNLLRFLKKTFKMLAFVGPSWMRPSCRGGRVILSFQQRLKKALQLRRASRRISFSLIVSPNAILIF